MLRLLATCLVAASLAMPGSFPGSGPTTVDHSGRVHAEHGASASGWSSSNWSGYGRTGGTYTAISANWTVPAVEATPAPTYSALWIGIGGFDNQTLIQAGTEQDYSSRGVYYAWWEDYPKPEVRIGSLAVAPGDRMVGSINRTAPNSWAIALVNESNGQRFSTAQTYQGSLDSVGWIMEAPTVAGRVSDLGHYGSTTFIDLAANGQAPGLTPSEGGNMVQNSRQISTPSQPNGDGDGFALAYGGVAPPPPP